MCVIAFSPEGKIPSTDLMTRCAQYNPYGAGVMWIEDNTVCYQKGILATEELLQVLQILKGATFAIHWRFTAGTSRMPELTHPFPVSQAASLQLQGKTAKALMYSGVYPGWQKLLTHAEQEHNVIRPAGNWTVTRAIAWLTALYGDAWINLHTPGKVLLFTAHQASMYGVFRNEKEIYWSTREFEFPTNFSVKEVRK